MSGMPSWISGRGQETLPDDREWSGGPPDVRELLGDSSGCPGVVGRLSRMSLRGGSPSRMSGSCRETLLDACEGWGALPDVRQLSGGPPGCPGVVGSPSQMSGSGRESLPDVWEWSGGSPGCPGVVVRLSWISRSGRKALPDVWEWKGGPPGCQRVVGRRSRMSGSGRKAPRMSGIVRIALPDVRGWSGGPLGCSGVVGRPF